MTRSGPISFCLVALSLVFASPGVNGQSGTVAATGPKVTLAAAPAITLPGGVDSNSPAVWDLEDGLSKLFVFTSTAGAPSLSEGLAINRLGPAAPVAFTSHPGNGLWMEAVVTDDVGTWYGYYHNENPAIGCGRPDRAIARIGAARSEDRGRTWEDLGIIIEAPTETVACNSQNRYVIGGVGDLSVMLDEDKSDLYIFFSQYQEQASAQGVAVARLRWADRDRPVAKVMVWNNGAWLRAHFNRTPTRDVQGDVRRVWWEYPTGTPLVSTTEAWHDADPKVDAFWGPSVHWNQAIQQYVMLLNRAKDENYSQDGIYVSFAPQLDDPRLWTPPQKILSGGKWYPQVIGLGAGSGTDKSADATARLFISGRSDYTISFSR
jgi:hypothetical protein